MAITIDGTNGLTTDNAALKLDGTTLTVDDTNNRVGIGTASPAVALDVSGYARASTGILFGTDTAAANALDDYEEGTWTPILKDGSGNSATMNIQTGYYRKVGSLVYATCYISVARGSLSGSDLNIVGFPFTSLTSTHNSFPCSYWEALATAVVTINGSLGGNSVIMYIRKQASAQTSASNMAYTDITTSAGNVIRVSGCYISAS